MEQNNRRLHPAAGGVCVQSHTRLNEARMSTRYGCVVAMVLLILVLGGCKTSVEPSPSPGILRVIMKSADSDTTIVLLNDTSRFSRWDNFNMVISQGRLGKGDWYASIYANTSSERKTTDTINALGREWLTGIPITWLDTDVITPQNSRWRKYTVFESYVPPGTYDRLTFAVTANEMEIFIPKHYLNPVGLPPGVAPSLDFTGSFAVQENGITEVTVEVQPYKSLRRYQDQFYFERKISIVRVQAL
jgi:hypothetical protein